MLMAFHAHNCFDYVLFSYLKRINQKYITGKRNGNTCFELIYCWQYGIIENENLGKKLTGKQRWEN